MSIMSCHLLMSQTDSPRNVGDADEETPMFHVTLLLCLWGYHLLSLRNTTGYIASPIETSVLSVPMPTSTTLTAFLLSFILHALEKLGAGSAHPQPAMAINTPRQAPPSSRSTASVVGSRTWYVTSSFPLVISTTSMTCQTGIHDIQLDLRHVGLKLVTTRTQGRTTGRPGPSYLLLHDKLFPPNNRGRLLYRRRKPRGGGRVEMWSAKHEVLMVNMTRHDNGERRQRKRMRGRRIDCEPREHAPVFLCQTSCTTHETQ